MEQRSSILKFLRGCFSGTEWDYLSTQREFREGLMQIRSADDAEGLVSLGLVLLGNATCPADGGGVCTS